MGFVRTHETRTQVQQCNIFYLLYTYVMLNVRVIAVIFQTEKSINSVGYFWNVPVNKIDNLFEVNRPSMGCFFLFVFF